MAELQIKRIYDPPSPDDGFRVLVDRLWPRGVSHERAALDVWLKEVAPSPQLRSWWDHDPLRVDEFAERYRAELDQNPALEELREVIRDHARVTLLFAAHDPAVNHAIVLRDYLERAATAGKAKHVQQGGSPVCYLSELCLDCGAITEAPAAVCWRCGKPLPNYSPNP